MHDPLTVALEIRYPWLAHSKAERLANQSEFTQTWRAPFITIWHLDPEKDGSDDSCDWSNQKGKLNAKEKAVAVAVMDLEDILDNGPHYPDSQEHKAWQPLHGAILDLLRKPSRTHWWQVHPRWHIWHWSIQIHPYQQARRWLLTRCSKCGDRFAYGESPVTGNWNSKPPRWFRGEEGLYHEHCHLNKVSNTKDCARSSWKGPND